MNHLEELAAFAAVLADAPWALFSYRLAADGSSSIPYVSEAFQRLLGVDPAALREDASPLLARMLPEDVPRYREAVERSARTLSPLRGEFGFSRADGAVVWVEASATPSRAPDGATLWRGVCLDITAQRRADATRDLLARLVTQAPASIALFDRDLTYLAASRQWTAAVRPDLDDLRGRRHYEVAPDLPERWKEAHRAGLAGEVREAEDDLWILADGTRRWFRWAVYPWRDAEGAVGGILITGEDVTRRKEAEEATAASELQLAAIIRSAMDGIITVDASQTILLANPAAERMFGYGPGELVGKPLDRLIPARFQRAHRDHVRTFGEAGVTHRTMAALGDVEGVRANGKLFRLEATKSQNDLDGRKLFTVIHRDVSERLRAERALKEEEARFRQLAEAIREVFWLTDVAKQRVEYISPGYEAIWGRSCQSLYDAPTTWMDAIHPDDRERVRRAALTQQADGGYDLQYRVVRPDGSIRWIHDRAFPVREGADVVRIAGVAEDITERRRLEEQFQQTQKMESVGRLAGGVAHDFNNLLTIILSSAELLREDPAGPFAGEMVDDILDAGRRGATLTRQLLAFTRQEVIEPRVLDLATVVADTEKLLRRLIGEDVELTVRLDSAAAPVRVDPGQWTQVLLNLAVNARDAMPTGGTLRIATRAVVADEALLRAHPTLREGVHAVLEVSDSGGGMSPEVRARVFEPFFTTKPRGKGTGLGLAVVYGVVQQAGGVIEVDSAAGRGTAFTLYVPAVNAAVTSLSDALAASMRPGREVVLLVEDEAAVRRVASRILTAKGYRVITAANGREALQVLERHEGPLDLVLTDVVMPELDGAALAAAVRARFPQARVLFASGYVDESVTLRGVRGEGRSFLQKPYSPGVLLQRVREVLDG